MAIRPSSSRGDLADALALAQQLAVQSGDAEVLVATDAALAVPPTTRVDAPIRVLRVGDPKGSRNQAIVALAVRTAPSAVSRSVFISVANLDLETANRRIEVWGDDHLVEAELHLKGPNLHGREAAATYEAATDVLIDKLERQIERRRDKVVREPRRRLEAPPEPTPVEEIEQSLRDAAGA